MLQRGRIGYLTVGFPVRGSELRHQFGRRNASGKSKAQRFAHRTTGDGSDVAAQAKPDAKVIVLFDGFHRCLVAYRCLRQGPHGIGIALRSKTCDRCTFFFVLAVATIAGIGTVARLDGADGARDIHEELVDGGSL